MAQQAHPTNPLALAVLALLFERPMHPYEMGVIAQAAAQRGEHQIPLRLALYGDRASAAPRFSRARETARDGRRPERTVYEITDAGRDELRAWMADLIGEPIKEYPQFEAALCLLPVLPPDEALALLRLRLERIAQNSAALTRQIEAIADQNFPPLFLDRDRVSARADQSRAAFRRRIGSADRERLGTARALARHTHRP